MRSARRCVEEANVTSRGKRVPGDGSIDVSIPFDELFPSVAAGRYELWLLGFEEAGVGPEDVCSNAAHVTLTR
jgi:hypothetical protein